MPRKNPNRERGPSLEALRDLLAFHECEGVTQAARKLGEHQPVVTRRLKVFQDKTKPGQRLLERDGNKLKLTDTGLAVIPTIRQLIDQYDHLLNYIRAESTKPQSLRLGCGTFSVSQYLPEIVVQFQNEHPEVDMVVRIERGADRIWKTAAGRYDISIVTHSPAQIRETLEEMEYSASALVIEDLCHHRLAVLAHYASAEGDELERYDKNRPLPVTALKKWELVGLDRDSGVRRQLETAVAPDELYFSGAGGGWAAAREYARLHMGVAILPEAMLTEDDRKKFVIRSLGKDFVVTDRIIYRKQDANPAVKDAVRLLTQTLKT